jgi:hypothetical protein
VTASRTVSGRKSRPLARSELSPSAGPCSGAMERCCLRCVPRGAILPLLRLGLYYARAAPRTPGRQVLPCGPPALPAELRHPTDMPATASRGGRPGGANALPWFRSSRHCCACGCAVLAAAASLAPEALRPVTIELLARGMSQRPVLCQQTWRNALHWEGR